jgi:uncharacterized repeat protein (TIGR03806 family)
MPALLLTKLIRIGALACGLALVGCDSAPTPPHVIAEGNPASLAEWGQINVRHDTLTLGEGVVAYELNSPLFTDYAHKLRTIWMPPGLSGTYSDDTVFDFPIGTVITKTFYYPRADTGDFDEVARTNDTTDDFAAGELDLSQVRLIETRILVRRESGWVAIPYLWDDTQSAARLTRTGAIIPLTLIADGGMGGELDSETGGAFNYVMPDVNQCASCHAPDSNTRILSPIGPQARHLNRDYDWGNGDENQIAHLAAIGYLDGVPDLADAPRNADWADPAAPLDARARSYLDVNCAHCHSPVGPADTSGLFLETTTPMGASLGICKLPIAAGAGTGNRSWDIVPGQPDDSILVYRMDNLEPDEMMPELGRSTTHHEGVALIRDWIESLDGDCDL